MHSIHKCFNELHCVLRVQNGLTILRLYELAESDVSYITYIQYKLQYTKVNNINK